MATVVSAKDSQPAAFAPIQVLVRIICNALRHLPRGHVLIAEERVFSLQLVASSLNVQTKQQDEQGVTAFIVNPRPARFQARGFITDFTSGTFD